MIVNALGWRCSPYVNGWGKVIHFCVLFNTPFPDATIIIINVYSLIIFYCIYVTSDSIFYFLCGCFNNIIIIIISFLSASSIISFLENSVIFKLLKCDPFAYIILHRLNTAVKDRLCGQCFQYPPCKPLHHSATL